jgi:hypothetical protein
MEYRTWFYFALKLKSQCREKDRRIKELDANLQNLKDQHHNLLKLSRERNLGEREHLTKRVEELQEIIRDQDIRIQVWKFFTSIYITNVSNKYCTYSWYVRNWKKKVIFHGHFYSKWVFLDKAVR